MQYYTICLIFLMGVCAGKVFAQPDGLEVTITGVEGVVRDNVAAFLRINRLAEQVAKGEQTLPGQSRLRWLHEQAANDISQALQPFGYYAPEIKTSLQADAELWRARYDISLGPPLPIDGVDIQVLGAGADDAEFKRVLADVPLKPGQTLEHQKYQTLKQTLGSIAAERGYFDARLVRSEIAVDLAAYNADIVLHYESGKRYRYGEISFDQDILAEQFLDRYLNIAPGDYYQAAELLQLQTNLIASDYFEQVLVSASPSNAQDGVIPVKIELAPRKKSKYTFGIGYGTDTGVRGRAGLERRWTNRWGHRYETFLLGSQVKFSLAGKYEIPTADPRTDSYAVRADVTQENSDVKDSLSASIGIGKYYQDGPWFKILGLDYQWEKFTIGNREETTKLLIPKINWSRVDADDRLFVSDGSRFGFEVRGGSENLFSDISFAQAVVSSKWIKSLAKKHRLIARAELGGTLIDDGDFERLPTSLRFYAGGDNSVRGYKLDSIGPLDGDGEVAGGKYLLIGSVEYDYEFRDRWSFALFADRGDAFDNSPDFKTGVGIGLRWRSPVGPVRVDLAHGLDEPGDDFRIHLTIGPDL